MLRTKEAAHTTSVATAPVKNIAMGSRTILATRLVVIALSSAVTLIVGASILPWIFIPMGINPLWVRCAALLLVICVVSAACAEMQAIYAVEYFVEDGILQGNGAYIDLWNLTTVRTGSHTVYLNAVALPRIAKPKVFLDNLDTLYSELTGEPLP